MYGSEYGRRAFLARMGGAAFLLGTGSSLAACSSDTPPTRGGTFGSAKLPTYIPYSGVTADLAGTPAGVDPAFYNYPSQRPKAIPSVPGTGQTLTSQSVMFFAPPPGPENNSYWAGLNERLGVNLKFNYVANADWLPKFSTTIAGGDLPDMMSVRTHQVPQLPRLLDAKFAPLDEYLAGDAIKDYPNLANLPERSWRATVFNGQIYGIPITRGPIGFYHYVRQDLFEARGLSPNPRGFDELIETGKALTDSRNRRWAYAIIQQPRQILAQVNGEPNVWRDEQGKLTHAYETEEFKRTVADLIEIWKSGVVHPDAFNPAQPFKQLFNAGTVAINAYDGYFGWNQYILDNTSNPEFKLGLMATYNRDGSELAHWNFGPGFVAMTSLKKQEDPELTKLTLRVMDYLAAPFGTEEHFYRKYGQEGIDHTVDANGNPSLTKTGAVNTVIPLSYISDSPVALYQAGRPQDADTQHQYQSLTVPKGVHNPVVGHYSETAVTVGARIETKFIDDVNSIIQGRRPYADLDAAVREWVQGGGDKMRTEYQEGMQQAG